MSIDARRFQISVALLKRSKVSRQLVENAMAQIRRLRKSFPWRSSNSLENREGEWINPFPNTVARILSMNAKNRFFFVLLLTWHPANTSFEMPFFSSKT